MDLLTEMQLAIADGLQSHSLTDAYRWSRKRRYMSNPDFEGWYTAKHHPWVKEILRSKAPFNYALKAAQTGLTEVLINLAFYTIDQRRRDVLYVLPTSKNASDFSKARFNTALKVSPYLNSIFTDTNSIELKQAGSNTLYIRGSRGDSNLKSIPVSVLFMDEIDEMSQRAIALALERLSGQLEKTVWGISTPTIPNYGIDKLYKDSTKEHFTFKCPCCGRATELVWPDCIEIIGESSADPRCHGSFLKCKECGGRLEHKAKPNFLKRAEFIPSVHNGNPDIRGFHISQLYSYTVTPGEIVVAHFKGFGDEASAVEFHNSKLGRPYIGSGAKISKDDIQDCIKPHSMEDLRPKVGYERFITMGVDQGKYNYVEVAEWFYDDLTNDLNANSIPRVLYATTFHEEDWHHLDEMMREWQVLHCVVDADPQIMEARRFARRFEGFVTLCRFRRGPTAKEISNVEDGEGAPIVHVDRTNWFSAALGRFRRPRRIMLPHDIPQQYMDHIEAPVRTYVKEGDQTKKKGHQSQMVCRYLSTGPDHYALARVYNEIALPLAAATQSGEDVEKFL